MFFEPNHGQFPQRVRLAGRSDNYILYMASQEFIFRKRGATLPKHPNGPARNLQPVDFSMRFLGTNPHARAEGLDALPSHTNYFRGSDPSRWRTGIPNYARVEYANVYAGISLVCYSRDGDLELDWVVAPGADPSKIRFSVEGAVPEIESSGDLVMRQATSEIRQKKPAIFQEDGGARKAIEGGFALGGGKEVSFQVGKFDRHLPLVIDPVIVYSTWLGGSRGPAGSGENPAGIGVDAAGDIYIAGITSSADFPLANPLQSTFAGIAEGFVTKLSPDGSTLLYSTYIGGTDGGGANAFAVDPSGNVYLTGHTDSTNYPTTPGAFQPTPVRVNNLPSFTGFVTKLNPTGSALIFSTYLGGSNGDNPYGITYDGTGNVYVVGSTTSKDFPVTPGALRTTFYGNGYSDAFVTKLNPTGTALIYSTYLGGTSHDEAYSVAADASGNAYVTGRTWSGDFPAVTEFHGFDGFWQAFVVKIDEQGTQLLYSTVFGSGWGTGIALDQAGNAYIAGTADYYLFPTVGAFQGNCTDYDAFLAKLDPTGANLVYSMCIGGSSVETSSLIALDTAHNAYVTGRTQSADFPVVNPVQAVYGGSESCQYNCSDAFVTEVSADGSQILFSTYLGDSGFEQGNGLAVDSTGNIYVTGYSDSDDFPTAHPYDSVRKTTGTNKSAFITEISPNVSISPQRLIFGLRSDFPYLRQALGTISSPLTTTFTNHTTGSLLFSRIQFSGPAAADYSASADTCSGLTLAPGAACGVDVVFTPTQAGARNANLLMQASAPGSPFVVLLRGFGMPLLISPPAVDFGVIPSGTTNTPQSVKITNVGTGNIHITSLTGNDPSEFVVQTDTCSGATLAAHGACAISLTFTAPYYCRRKAVLAINDDDPDSPQSLPLVATGSGSYADFSPLQLIFTSQLVGTSASQTVKMTNTGTSTMHISSVAFTSSNTTSDFTQTNNCGSTVASGASCSFVVTFKSGGWGDRSANLQITGDMFGGMAFVVLTAEGEDFTLGVPTGKPTATTVTRGQTATYSAYVAPMGGYQDHLTFTCSGAPEAAACTVSPSVITLVQSQTENLSVTVTTTASSVAPLQVGPKSPPGFAKWRPVSPGIVFLLVVALGLVLCGQWASRGHCQAPFLRALNSPYPRRFMFGAPCLACLLVLMALAPACGGGGTSGGGGGITNPGTPSGTYTLTLTGTATQGSATVSHSVTLTLIVQ